MPRINVLPKTVAELIAAGEVVERPASVIKELLENSVDSGASSVTAEIKNGGITYIRVSDNGCGIEKNDIRKAFMSHATSKISSENDLNSILTLGFRGEALSSIAAVSKVEIITKTLNCETGVRYCIEAGEETSIDDAGCPLGTTIVVRDLFFCTPARMKFLKKDVTEGNYVTGVVERIALSHPDISFRFIRDGKQAILTSGSGDIATVVREVFGKDFSESMIPVNGDVDGIKVSGLISLPHSSRPNRNMQFFFINGRYVKTATGSAALSEAYKNSVMVGKFPSCVLNIAINPQTVDVNVHPVKTEVRFSNEKSVFSAVYFTCKNALSEDSTRAEFKYNQKDFYAQLEKAPEQVTFSKKNNPDFWEHKSVNTAVDNIKADSSPDIRVYLPSDKESGTVFKTSEPPKYSVNDDDKPSLIPEDYNNKNTEPASEDKDISAVSENDFCEENFRLIGEAFKTYIIVEYNQKIIVIDKHAAHERVIYEKIKQTDSERTAQVLLAPVSVRLNNDEYSALLSNTDLLKEAGFDVADFGQGTVIVNECPMEVSADEVEDIICEIAGNFADKKQSVNFDKLDNIYHSVACRSAIKAGNNTSRYEMEVFAKQILSMLSIKYCPHGRPVLIEITQRELEKSFGRV